MPPARLQAPHEHRGVLAVPPLGEAGALLEINQARLAHPVRILDRPLTELRVLCKSEVRRSAETQLKSLGVKPPDGAPAAWIATGHQPDLFHPGVWVKNFAAAGLARRHGLIPLHLIVDNDAIRLASIRVPGLNSTPVATTAIAFDTWVGSAPYEETPVHDEEQFSRFPAEVQTQLAGASFQPLLPKFWEHVRSVPSPLLGMRLAGGRRLLEETWGCKNLEVPMSRVCQSEAFAWFALHVLEQLPRFQAIHNKCLLASRRQRRIRSRNHPVPELASDGAWLEVPFWIWRTGSSTRRRLFVMRRQATLMLRLDDATTAELPTDGPAERRVAGLRELEGAGWKLRTRALTTTMFARLFLADLFVHGIGGAIYDELTDEIIRRFFGLEPPAFLTLSATLQLPLVNWQGAAENERRVRRRLRDLEWNPQRYLPTLDGPAGARPLLRERERLVAWTPTNCSERRQRFQELRRVTRALLPHLKTQRRLLETTAARLGQLTETEQVARDRNYAFCLYPEAELREFMGEFL